MKKAVLLLVLLATLVTGCTAERYGLRACLDGRDPTVGMEQEIRTSRYLVRTDAGSEAAMELAAFLEKAEKLWTPLLGEVDPSLLPLEVRLYRDGADLSRLLKSQQLTPYATGLYLPDPSPVFHVACRGREPGHPYRTLLHEGSHQLIHLATGYSSVPGQMPRLAIPLWLNEGLAAWFEGAYVSPELLVAGRPDSDRLEQLQRELRWDAAPRLENVMGRRYGESFRSIDYAVSWGVVYLLMQDDPPPWAQGGQEWLHLYLQRCRAGEPGQVRAKDGAPLEWWGGVTEYGLGEFRAYVAASGLSMAEWEQRWREWILSLP